MTTISNTYINALLADATYVHNLNSGSDLKVDLAPRMTPTIADYISQNFSVVTQIQSGDNILTGDSGFDATVWRQNAGGKLYISMRGTEPGSDLAIADLDLALTANARFQLVDMVNWWFRETGAPGQAVRQIGITVSPGPIPPLITFAFIEAAPAIGTGRITATDLAAGIEVNGHSLGGYLATAFTRLFGTQAHVQHTSTFNSAGFAPGSESVFQRLESLVGAGYGLGRFPNAAEQTNYFAEHGINLTTNSLWFSQQGTRVELFNEEDATQVGNHFMYKMTDALALAAAMEKLDPSMTVARANAALEYGSAAVVGEIEGVLDGLRRLVQGPAVAATPNGDVSDSAGSRLGYYANLRALQSSSPFQSMMGKVRIDVSSNVLGGKARTDFGALAALSTLSPVWISGNGIDDAPLTALWNSGAWSGDYAQWQTDKNLSRYERDGGKVTFTDQWMTDRANLLAAINRYNVANSTGNVVSSGGRTLNAKNVYTDIVTARTLTEGPGSLPARYIKFGGGDDDTLLGEVMDDHLYGGVGDDSLNGQSGDDYLQGDAGADSLDGGDGNDSVLGGGGNDTLIGGTGNDVLLGGADADSYQFNADFGRDTIEDSDGQGTIQVDGVQLTGARRPPTVPTKTTRPAGLTPWRAPTFTFARKEAPSRFE